MYGGGERVQQIRVETCRNGKVGVSKQPPVSLRTDGPVTLRLERKGDQFDFTYSSDGRTWLPVRKSAINLSPRVEVGISASNISTKTFKARFEEFDLERASGGGG